MARQGPVLGGVGKLIQDVLRSSRKPLSTYEIAKKIGVSWATANIHCYKMKVLGVLDCRSEEVKIGMKRMVWWVKR